MYFFPCTESSDHFEKTVIHFKHHYSQRVHFCMTKDNLRNFHIIFCLSAWKNQQKMRKCKKKNKSLTETEWLQRADNRGQVRDFLFKNTQNWMEKLRLQIMWSLSDRKFTEDLIQQSNELRTSMLVSLALGLVVQSVVTWQRNSYRIDWSELVLSNSLMLQKKLHHFSYSFLYFSALYLLHPQKNTLTHRKSTSASVSRSSVLTSQ